MRHESTDTRDTQDTRKSPQHTQQAHEFAPGTQADCMLASSCSPGRLCPLCLIEMWRWHKVFTKKIWCVRCMHFGGFVEKAKKSIGRPHDQNGMPRARYDCM